jgi:alkylhydroperoxidase family enzyme
VSSEDPFGLFGDPEELRRRMAEFAEQMQGAQKVAWADNAIKLAVDMTVAAINRMNLQGSVEQQAGDLRKAMTTLFPEAVTLVREGGVSDAVYDRVRSQFDERGLADLTFAVAAINAWNRLAIASRKRPLHSRA